MTDKAKILWQTISMMGIVAALGLEVVGTNHKSIVLSDAAVVVGTVSAIVVFCCRFPKGYKPKMEQSVRTPVVTGFSRVRIAQEHPYILSARLGSPGAVDFSEPDESNVSSDDTHSQPVALSRR